MKIINKITGEIINIIHVDFVNSKIRIERQATKYSEAIEEDYVFDISSITHERAKADVRVQILANENFADFDKIENYNDWLAPEKAKRLYVTNDQVTWFELHADQFVQMLKSEPRNPMFIINGGVEVYLSNIDPLALPILEQFGIKIEERAEILTT